LVDELNDTLIDQRSRQQVQDQLRRLLAVVTTHFRNEDGLFLRYGYLDGPRHSKRHSEIVAKFQKLSDKLNSARLPAVWIECGSRIGRMLEDHLEEERVIYGT
jgi:hemerythrin-like metal-binding protein